MLDHKGFDLWADGYDKSVGLNEENGKYPFAGYKDVLNDIYRKVREQDGAEILDIGFGTGVLTARLYDSGCHITGVDFSAKMIGLARRKMPGASLIQWDFSKSLPEEVCSRRFDDIVSTYALHHLTDDEKMRFIRSLSGLLKPGGRILVGDVSFETRRELEECREHYHDIWDDDEQYFVSEEIKRDLGGGLDCKFLKISHCAGVFTITEKD